MQTYQIRYSDAASADKFVKADDLQYTAESIILRAKQNDGTLSIVAVIPLGKVFSVIATKNMAQQAE